jgi:hypothetical protein
MANLAGFFTLPDVNPGETAEAATFNQVRQDILSWSQGNIQEDNLGTFSGLLSWTITTGVGAISVANSGDQGSIELTQSQALNPNRSGVKLSHTGAEVSGDAGLFVDFTNASSSIPAGRFHHAGSGSAIRVQQSGSGKYFLANDGVNDEFSVDGDALIFSPGAVQAFKVSSSGVRVGLEADGPLLTRDAANRMRVADEIVLGSSDGPVLKKKAATTAGLETSGSFTTGGDIIVDGGPELSNEAGDLGISSTALRFSSNARMQSSDAVSFRVLDNTGTNRGNVILGTNSTGRALRLIRGSITPAGSISEGEGFTCLKIAPGRYQITYSTPYVGGSFAIPVVTRGTYLGNFFPNTTAENNAGFILETRGGAGALSDIGWSHMHFHVLGRYA